MDSRPKIKVGKLYTTSFFHKNLPALLCAVEVEHPDLAILKTYKFLGTDGKRFKVKCFDSDVGLHMKQCTNGNSSG